ncbi:DUF4469 domain-containing protein [Parabacteroides sp.]
MDNNEPKKRSITGNVVPNYLTEREDDFTMNISYMAKRSIEDLCKFAALNKSKFSASELLTAYNEIKEQAKQELYNSSTVEFGFFNNALGVDGALIGPSPKFDPAKNSVVIRATTLAEIRKELNEISVIVNKIEEGMPTISTVTDVVTGIVNKTLTPSGNLNGTGKRLRIVGDEGKPVGFFFVNADNESETPVPMTSVSRNEPANFSFTIPNLSAGSYYLDIATQYGGNSKRLVKEVRRNRFPYLLTVTNDDDDDRPVIE